MRERTVAREKIETIPVDMEDVLGNLLLKQMIVLIEQTAQVLSEYRHGYSLDVEVRLYKGLASALASRGALLSKVKPKAKGPPQRRPPGTPDVESAGHALRLNGHRR